MPRHLLRSALLLPFLIAPTLAQDAPAAPPQPAYEAAPYQRIVNDPETGAVSLQMAVREFAPPAAREGMPRVYLAGAVHIGREDFYRSLQEFLDAQDVVLFEGVKPPGAGDPAMDEGVAQTDQDRAKATERRIRFIAMAVERFRARNKRLPADFDDLAQGSGERIGSLLRGATGDAWGHPLAYTLLPAQEQHAHEIVDGQPIPANAASRKRSPGFDIVSAGADGVPGGPGSDDLRFSDQKPLSRPETGDRSDGIQQRLADALGLVFQLTAMNHDRPNWRNSDLAVDQVQARLDKAGANADQLFSMLDGSSLFSRIGSFFLTLMSQSDQQKAMLRVMMIEVIGRADKLMASGAGGPAMGGANVGKMMGVLLEDRNAVVLADLRKLLASEHPPRTIAIIYGAGHLPTMEQRLVQELGYTPAGDTWRTAMDVDPAAAGITAGELKQMRTMMGQMFDRQLNPPARKNPAPAPAEEPVNPPS